MRPGLRLALTLLVLLPSVGTLVFLPGYRRIHAPILTHATFGQTPAQCQSAYGPAYTLNTDPRLISPKTRGYVRGNLSIMVSFDERERAEQFIFSRAHLLGEEFLSEQEQQALLAVFSQGGHWTPQPNVGNGPIWQKEDGTYASYLKNKGWLVFINKEGMDRKIKELHIH